MRVEGLEYPARGEACVKSRTVNSGTIIWSGSVPFATPRAERRAFCIELAGNCTALDVAWDMMYGDLVVGSVGWM